MKQNYLTWYSTFIFWVPEGFDPRLWLYIVIKVQHGYDRLWELNGFYGQISDHIFADVIKNTKIIVYGYYSVNMEICVIRKRDLTHIRILSYEFA